MSGFGYVDGRLCADNLPLSALAAQFGTPLYVYSRARIEENWRAYADALSGRSHLICYAVKANGNLAVLDVLARLGSGFDIVSVGELERVLRAGGDPGKVVFSGVGKRTDEMRRALEAGIRCFNVESTSELKRLNDVARALHTKAPVSLRVNPDVDPDTHPYIATGLSRSKFGIPFDEAQKLYDEASGLEHVDICGLDCHIGSQITALGPFRDAVLRLAGLAKTLKDRGIVLRHVDVGGGLEWLDGDTDARGFFTPPGDPGRVDPSGLGSDNTAERRALGLFAQNSWSPRPDWTLVAGLRYDRDEVGYFERVPDPTNVAERTYSELSLRGGASWSPSDRWTLYLSFGEGFLPPTVEELFSFPLFGSNAELRPEDSESWEIGAHHRIAAITQRALYACNRASGNPPKG